MSKKIVLAHAWSLNNIGDIGITPGMISLLKEYVPEYEITALSMYQHGSSEWEQVRDYLKAHFSDIEVVGHPSKDRENSKLAGVLFEPLREFMRTLPSEYDRAITGADFIIYNSGTVLSFGRWGKDFWKRTLFFSLPLILAKRLEIPYGIYANSFERFDYPGDVFFRWLFKDAKFLSTRETDSLRFIKEKDMVRGIPDVRFGMEATLAFPFREDEWAGSFMNKHGLEPRKFIALTLRTSEPALTPVSDERRDLHMTKMAGLAAWAHRKGWKTLVCPEVISEIERGRKLLLPKISKDVMESVIYMDHFWSPEQARAVYAKAGVLTTMEFHSILLALQDGIPILHPYFAEAGRKKHMLVDMGLGDFLFDLDHMSDSVMEKKLDEVYDNWEKASQQFRKAYERMRDIGRESMDVVSRAIREYSN